jgi:hypothetical protein
MTEALECEGRPSVGLLMLAAALEIASHRLAGFVPYRPGERGHSTLGRPNVPPTPELLCGRVVCPMRFDLYIGPAAQYYRDASKSQGAVEVEQDRSHGPSIAAGSRSEWTPSPALYR